MFSEPMANGRSIKSAPITVRVGSESETFFVHEHLLCTNSMFFARALKKEWAEGEARQVDLPDVDPDTFEIWAKWLYTGRLCYAATNRDEDFSIWLPKEWVRWAKIYALGDFLQDTDLKDAAIDAHVENMLELDGYCPILAKWVYPYSSARSAHRKLAVDLFVATWVQEDLVLRKASCPTDFSYDVLNSLGPRLSNRVGTMKVSEFFRGADRCKYHDHGEEKPCYRTRPTFTL